MNVNSMYWMNYSIDIASKTPISDLQVGVVLVSEHNELICSAYAGENCNTSWCSILLGKIRKLKISYAHSIYMTINTLSTSLSFDLNKLLMEIHINEIYIGIPDPALSCYLGNDPAITLNHVYRYPDELQRKILEQNNHHFADSRQSIKYSPYYSENRISSLVIEKLKSKGFVVSKSELNANKQMTTLAFLICNKYGIEYSGAICAVYDAVSEAFNRKYARYDYSNDTRSLDLSWKESFMSFYDRSSVGSLSTKNIINVGVGSGYEAISLFSNCAYVTFVDIAQAGLEKIKEQIPQSKIIVSSADDLSSIPDNSQDLYVSLRTYNSSFFAIKEAISEAHRVLKLNAVIIVSVANGFLCPERHSIIPGLIIPGTEFVDIYRGMDTIKLMHIEFLRAGFREIKIFPTNTEIYLSAVVA